MGPWQDVSWTTRAKQWGERAKFGRVLTGEVTVDVAHELFLSGQQKVQEAITAARFHLG